ncbi:MAG TPA: cytidine deaminase [Thermoanaerobaculia bacterium]|nr:cytidine deaminase [Thermoanaerobaculia bacterium]
MNPELPISRGIVAAADATAFAERAGIDIPSLMTRLLPEVAKLARPPVSNFFVGAVSRGLTGNLYFGTNLEFAGEALSFTVHAEQSSVANAWMNGEEGIDMIAVTAAPCGYCRQFLNELATADRLTIAIPNETHTLRELLPSAFGPRDLGIDGGLMQREEHALSIDVDDELARAALTAARRSYAPYSKSYAGIAIRTKGGTIATGAYAENAAFNPSMSPLEVALSQLNFAGGSWEDIDQVTLVAVDDLHTSATRVVLTAISRAPLRLLRARNSG